jgi:APA family basic amino acid/polyamine antiporter
VGQRPTNRRSYQKGDLQMKEEEEKVSVGGQLERAIGMWGAAWMGLGSILGTGVFVSLGLAAGIVGSGMVIAVILAAGVAIANGLSSAQLAAAYPVSGGTYAYGRALLHPALGFAAGWLFLVAKSASAATAALGFASYSLRLFGIPEQRTMRIGIAFSLVIALSALVVGGIRRSDLANRVIVSLTLLALASFVLMGILHLDPATLQKHLGFSVLQADLRASPWAIFHATALLFVAYTGYGRIATLGEEVRDPARVIPRAVILALLLSMVLYLSISLTATALVGAPSFAKATQEGAPLEWIARHIQQPWLARIIAFGAISAMLGVLLNLLLGLSRVLLAMAREHEMPHALAKVDEKNQSPQRAVWTMGAVIASLTLLGNIKLAWSLSAFTVLIYYGITNLCALALAPEQRRFPRPIAYAGLFSCLLLAFFVPLNIWLLGSALLALGFFLRFLFLRRFA